MTEEDYVSFETAKLLKEKGFDWETCAYWDLTTETHTPKIGIESTSKNWNYKWNPISFPISAPTLQMATKWLREIYKLEVRSTYDYDKDSWWGNINPMYEEPDEKWDIYQKALRFDHKGKSYEESCEAAIKYALENLI